MEYLDFSQVIERKETPQTDRYQPTYGNRLSMAYMLKLTDRRWRRVYAICYSNGASFYIYVKGQRVFINSLDL